MEVPFFRTPFNYDTKQASDFHVVEMDPNDVSLTIQSMTDDADINIMMQRFGVGQPLPQVARVPTFGDFTGVSDYRSALEAIDAAGQAFMELPPQVRAKFDNDPQMLMQFAANPDNVQELVKLGLGKEIQYGLTELSRDITSAISAGIAGGGGKPQADGAKPGDGGKPSNDTTGGNPA